MKLDTYCIQKGNKDYKPRDGFKVGKIDTNKYLVYEFEMGPNGTFNYQDPTSGEVDQDWHDWKKGGGLSLANIGLSLLNFIRLNRDNVMWVWRWNPIKKKYQFSAYSNSKGKRRICNSSEVVMELDPGQRGWCCINHKDDLSTMWFGRGSFPGSPLDGEVCSFLHRRAFSCYRIIGLYYGGKNNASGIWGGRAPVSHCHRVGREFIAVLS